MPETMHYDVAVIGAGPAGLSAAIRLKQLAPDMRVCVLEKGAQAGAHILSGAVFDPVALSALLPDWRERGAPMTQPATEDRFLLLTGKRALPLPTPPSMKNGGCYVISLGELCAFLAREAEALGVEIFPGFAAAAPLIEQGRLVGVATGDFGIARDGSPKANFQPGVEIRAAHTLLAEGCRGSLSEALMREFDLRRHADPQSYGLGIKEVWEVAPENHRPGSVLHTLGWPLDTRTYGGGFAYHAAGGKVALGLIVGLDYENPYLDPYEEFQRLKTHPAFRALLSGGRRIGYGARALNEGGLQSLPALSLPGGSLIGCAAGFLNVARIKGSHLAMLSGMLAAEALAAGAPENYPDLVRDSLIYKELHAARNIRPAFRKWGLWGGMANAALESYVFRGHAPWTLRSRVPDRAETRPASGFSPIAYTRPDGVLTFGRMESVYLSGTNHEENQPVHLKLKDAAVWRARNCAEFAAPETRYCPAGVYEVAERDGEKFLQINAQNCVHCKTCDIKDPDDNIRWTPPEGGGGPNYAGM